MTAGGTSNPAQGSGAAIKSAASRGCYAHARGVHLHPQHDRPGARGELSHKSWCLFLVLFVVAVPSVDIVCMHVQGQTLEQL